MQRISIDELQPGMLVGRSIITSEGKILLNKNTMLTEKYIERLKQLGLGSIYIKHNLADVEIPEVISTGVRSAVAVELKKTFQTVRSKGHIDTQLLKKGVGFLIDNVMSNRDLLISLEDIRTYNDYLLGHSINVSVLSIMAGISMGYNELNLMDLGIGALLHDIGLMTLDPHLLSKPGPLTPAETEQMSKHPDIGFSILRSLDVSLLSAHIAFQHHERWDGSGYPRGLSESSIIEYARIVAVADVFDALISDRPYRKGHSISEVLIILKKLAGTYFDPDITGTFISHIAIYPVGSLVKLNTGEIALVLSTSKKDPYRPLVTVILDQNGQLHKPAMKVDLSQTPEITIANSLTKAQTRIIMQKHLKNPINSTE